MPRKRRLVGVLVAMSAVVALAWAEQAERAPQSRVTLRDDSASYVVLANGRAIGRSRMSLRHNPDGGISAAEISDLQVPTPDGRSESAHIGVAVEHDPDGAVRNFQLDVSAAGPAATQNTRVRGRRDGAGLVVEVGSGGRWRRALRLPDAHLLVGPSLWAWAAVAAREGGVPASAVEFDPTSLAARPVEARRLPGGRVEVHAAAGSQYTVAFAGHSLPRTLDAVPGGIRYIAEGPGLAAPPVSDPGTTLVEASAIPAPGALASARPADTVRLRVVFGSDAAVLRSVHAALAGGGTQRIHGDTLVLLPPSAVLADPPPDSLARRPGPFIESDAPEILYVAKAIARQARSEEARVRLATRFVDHHLAKRYTASLPSALEAFRGGAGDCNEHAVLLVALLRGLGVPARVAVGLVVVDGRLYPHAWAEAYLRGGWRPADAALGEWPVRHRRIRLGIGIEAQEQAVGTAAALHLADAHTNLSSSKQ